MATKRKATGITRAPLEREEEEQAKVPPRGKSAIGKGRNRKPASPKAGRGTSSR
jgi:hypothetical protein